MTSEIIGVIGGSGLYEMEGMTEVSQVTVDTPFGRPSDEYVTGTLDGVRMVFLPRHGKGHRFTPSEVNYRANVYGMKKLGVTRIISVSAVGSLREEIVPGHIVIPDQFGGFEHNTALHLVGRDGRLRLISDIDKAVPFAEQVVALL